MLSQTRGQGWAAVGVGSLHTAVLLHRLLFTVWNWVPRKDSSMSYEKERRDSVSWCEPMALRDLLGTFHSESSTRGSHNEEEGRGRKPGRVSAKVNIFLTHLLWLMEDSFGKSGLCVTLTHVFHSVETHWRKESSELFSMKPQVGGEEDGFQSWVLNTGAHGVVNGENGLLQAALLFPHVCMPSNLPK